MNSQKTFTIFLVWSCLVSQLNAQQPVVERPQAVVLIRPYKPATVPPVRLVNGDRLRGLIRAGKLYLTVQDAIAAAIENNLDLELDRFGPLVSEWNLERQKAGGPLKGVTGGNSFVNQVTGGQGVAGAIQTAGLSGGGGGGGGNGTNSVIQQIGPVTQNLDAVFQNTSAWSHITAPQPNQQISQTTALIDQRHAFSSFVQQGLLSGGYVQVSANETYLKENTPADNLNPSVLPVVQITVRHNFLAAFGTGVNSRFIRVAKKNVTAASETFRSQLLNLVASVLNQYWDLVNANDDLKARQESVDLTQKFHDDTQHQIDIGVVAGVEKFRAEAELSTRKQELAISRATVRQQENSLKNTLSRNGLADPVVDAAEIVPLDSIHVPDSDELPPLRELVAKAMANRPDVALIKINNEAQEISALGTANGLLPTLSGLASTTASGVAGQVNPASSIPPPKSEIGGLGNALGQVFRRDYANRRGAIIFQGAIGNRVAQGDYGVEQLQLRQGDLVDRRNLNDMVVAISNQMVALRQAGVRYRAAVESRKLQEQLLDSEQKSFSLGGSTIDNVIAAQRSLSASRITEVAALGAYSRARVGLDQALGQTLETNNVSVDEALKGRVERESKLP